MRLGGHRPRRHSAENTLVALVDVVFLLILFFVLAGHFERLRLLSLGAVGTGSPSVAASAAPGRLAVLRIEGPEQLLLNGAPVAVGELPQRLQGTADVIVKVAPAVRLGDLVGVIDRLRDAGIAGFRLLEG